MHTICFIQRISTDFSNNTVNAIKIPKMSKLYSHNTLLLITVVSLSLRQKFFRVFLKNEPLVPADIL